MIVACHAFGAIEAISGNLKKIVGLFNSDREGVFYDPLLRDMG